MLLNMTIFRCLCFIALQSGAGGHKSGETTREMKGSVGAETKFAIWEFLRVVHCFWTICLDCAMESQITARISASSPIADASRLRITTSSQVAALPNATVPATIKNTPGPPAPTIASK